MITASEAKKETKKIRNSGVEQEIKLISMEIESAIRAGKNCVSFDGSISKQTKDYLKSLGYEVSSGMWRNEPFYSVKW